MSVRSAVSAATRMPSLGARSTVSTATRLNQEPQEHTSETEDVIRPSQTDQLRPVNTTILLTSTSKPYCVSEIRYSMYNGHNRVSLRHLGAGAKGQQVCRQPQVWSGRAGRNLDFRLRGPLPFNRSVVD